MMMLYNVVNGLLIKVIIHFIIFTVTSGTCWTLCITDVVMHKIICVCVCHKMFNDM